MPSSMIASSSSLASKDPPVGSKTDIATPRITPILKQIELSSVLKAKKKKRRKNTIRLVEPREPDANGVDKETVSETEDEEEAARCTFCPRIHHEMNPTMFENQYCAHPLIPGYGPQAAKVSEIGPYAGCTCIAKTSFLKSGLTSGKTGTEKVDGNYGLVQLTA